VQKELSGQWSYQLRSFSVKKKRSSRRRKQSIAILRRNPAMSKKILMVLTSHDQLGNTGLKTGFWLEEFAAPYYAFKDSGAEIVLASPAGGQPPLDPKSDAPDSQTEATHRFKADENAQQALAQTVKLASVKAADFDTVFYPGGHGPMWDLAESKDSIAVIEAFERAGKPIGFVCHHALAPAF
jgi:putative intracellular protease/amidase